MGNEIIQIKSDTDGCLYICNLVTGKWQQVCDIQVLGEIPVDVQKKFETAKRGMDALAR